ncbi:ATPase involved in DNA replication HolB, small subunit [Halapricum desulfuricans]|uniref:Replication factor C small subunit n=2 Tax=Halapricum desulfuricans TaxID=2841257 RepID=A0A897NIF7_9EURY|nr:ATPase involved in DNA replication HolB, small subunit [Halapricum desulfuricans]
MSPLASLRGLASLVLAGFITDRGHTTTMSEGESASRAGREEVWIEKYRPQTLSEVAGHEDIIERLQSYVDRNDLSHMLFSGPAGTGKCVTGDTPVLTNSGLYQIEDIVGDANGFEPAPSSLQVLSFADSGKMEYSPVSHLYSDHAETGIRITSRDGTEMTTTPEHRYLVITNDGLSWQPAADLEPGDRIVRPLHAPLPETDTDLDWLQALDGDRTLVHVSETFAREHDIPPEEQFVGQKKQIIRGLRLDQTPKEIASRTDVTRKYATAVRRRIDSDTLETQSTVCSLSYLRDLDVAQSRLQDHIIAIQRVATSNGRRSPPISPVWEVSPEIGEFLGLAVSEAQIEDGQIKFYNTDEQLLDRFESLAQRLFGIESKRGTQKDVPYVGINSRSLTAFLESCFDVFPAKGESDRAIGNRLTRADEKTRRRFLRAVFDAESHVSKNGIIELSQKDGRLITLLSYLLAGFGIPSRRKTKHKAATNGSGTERQYETLLISGASHLARFEDEVGFSIDYKREALTRHASKEGNPNHDTMPVQTAVDSLCDELNLSKSALVPKSLNPETPGRERYRHALDDVIEAASERLEAAQEVRETLVAVRPTIQKVSSVPIRWAETRHALTERSAQSAVAESTGISASRLAEYGTGDRNPYAGRAFDLLEKLDANDYPDIGELKATLRGAVDSLDLEYSAIANGTHLRGTDIKNLLTNNDHSIKSLTRFETVATRIDEMASEMLSAKAVELVATLDTLATARLYFDEVTEIETVDEPIHVYDLTVPTHRNYVAGEVPTVVHNTTSAMAIARELYGDDWQDNFLELNASDQRGIDVIRDRVKSFARTSFGGYEYRIIFLDEADALTSEAQSALRRTMEQFSNNVRFILSCNYSSQIIDPIQSRCAVFRFSPLGDDAIEEQIHRIAEAEGIEITDDGVEALIYVAGGDMRKAINGLQAASVTGNVVDEDAVFEITSTARPEEITAMVEQALDGDFTAARSELDRLLTDQGIAGGDILDQIHRSVWEFDVDDEAAVRILDRVGEADYRITEGANERIQLEALLAALALED